MARRRVRAKPGEIKFGIQISPDPRLISKLYRQYGEKLTFKPAFEALAPKWVAGIHRNIDAQGAPIRKDWPRWPAYQENYAKRKKGRPLDVTGKLKRSIEALKISRMSMRVGSRLSYAPAMQFGRKFGNVVRGGRAFVGVSMRMERQAMVALSRHARKAINDLIARINRLS